MDYFKIYILFVEVLNFILLERVNCTLMFFKEYKLHIFIINPYQKLKQQILQYWSGNETETPTMAGSKNFQHLNFDTIQRDNDQH